MSKQPPTFTTGTNVSSMTLKTQSKSLKETRKQTSKLEQESKNMEERLNDLKMLLSRDKIERSSNASSASANIWGSSNATASPVIKHHSGISSANATPTLASAPLSKSKPNSQKENVFPRRIKVLKDIPIEEPPKGPDQIMAYAKMMDRKPLSGSYAQRGTENNPICQTCSKKHVTVICTDCDDIFCSMCFAKAHLKGEPKKHKSIPFDPDKIPNSNRQSMDAQGDYFTKDGITFKNVEYPQNRDASFRSVKSEKEDVFDEQASAASFQEALMEWRKSGGETANQSQKSEASSATTQKATTHHVSKATGADSVLPTKSSDDVIAEFKFKEDSSLSYAEKLLLKKSSGSDSRPSSILSRSCKSVSHNGGELDEDANFLSETPRENVTRFFSNNGANCQFEVVKSEIEITEVKDDEVSFDEINETTLCSVVEPDFQHALPQLSSDSVILNSKTEVMKENPAAVTNVPGKRHMDTSSNRKTPLPARPVKSATKTPSNAKPKTPKTPSKPSKSKPVKPEPKNVKKDQQSRPTSAMSLLREPSSKLSEIAKLPKSGMVAASSDLNEQFSLKREQSGTEDHFTRQATVAVNNSNLITLRKSKAPWRPGSSLGVDVINGSADGMKATIDDFPKTGTDAEDFREFENEILLLENMGRESTRNIPADENLKNKPAFNSRVQVSAIPLDNVSDAEDEDQQTLDDLEYELACNTGRINEDGSRIDRITEDLEGILDDLEMNSRNGDIDLDRTVTNNEVEAEEKFSLSFHAEMEQDYLSDDEDYPQSVRNL